MNLTAIREEIASQLGEVVTATARIPAVSEITCPHAFISDMALRPVALGDIIDIDMVVTVLVSLADADTGWDTVSRLCDFGSDTSIVDALLSDRGLDGEIDSMTFVEIRALGAGYDVGGVTYLGFQMAFTVHA